MGDRRCCCGCEIGHDYFNRADSLTLGSNWPDTIEGNTAQTGDWDIHDNTAEMQDASGGRAVFKTKHPVPDESMYVGINCPDMHVGDIYEVIVNWKDMSNFHYAQIEVTIEDPPGVMWLTARLYSVSGGIPGLLLELEVGQNYADVITGLHHTNLVALIGDEGFCAIIDNVAIHKIWEMASPITGGYWAGMGASGRDDIQIDNFYFSQHAETDPTCPYCICKCADGYPFPKQLTATFVDCTGRMVGAEGCTIVLDWQQETIAGAPPYSGWYGFSEDCCGRLDVNFICNDGGTAQEMQCTVPASCNTNNLSLYASEASTCSPLILRFGPFQVTTSDLVCMCGTPFTDPDGEFYIEITA